MASTERGGGEEAGGACLASAWSESVARAPQKKDAQKGRGEWGAACFDLGLAGGRAWSCARNRARGLAGGKQEGRRGLEGQGGQKSGERHCALALAAAETTHGTRGLEELCPEVLREGGKARAAPDNMGRLSSSPFLAALAVMPRVSELLFPFHD